MSAGQANTYPNGTGYICGEGCTFEAPHGGPCGREIIAGVTTCPYCGHLDDSEGCKAAGCWQPIESAADVAMVMNALRPTFWDRAKKVLWPK